MDKVAVYTNADGKTCIVNFANNVYVPVGKSPLDRSDFVTIEGDPAKIMADRVVEGTIPPVFVKSNVRKATIEELAARDITGEFHIVDRDSIPDDRHFRDAWEHQSGEISTNMDKARVIHKGHLRERRAPLLAALDLEYLRADEAGDAAKKADIAARKQALRDITKHPDIAAASTPEELKQAGGI